MLKLRSVSMRASWLTLATATLCWLYPGHGSSLSNRDALSATAYIQRGNWVEEKFQAYSASLASYYNSLFRALSDNAPDLLQFVGAPEPIKSGYGILPELAVDPAAETKPRDGSVSYSWPWTEHMIDAEQRQLIRAENELKNALSLNPVQRQLLETLALDYRRLQQKARNIDEHIRYNRFWQAAIAADRGAYKRATALYDQVRERQAIRDELSHLGGGLAHASFMLTPIRAVAGVLGLTARLKARDALLTQRIDGALDRVNSPFVTLQQRSNEWICRVPMYTDIEDRAFVASVKQAIESIWRVENGTRRYRVEIAFTYLPPESLYANLELPAPGQAIDIRQHLRRFPANVAVLTTGGLTTYVEDNAIVLGPHPIAPRALAHEFGHILGFRDRYVRGYRDLRANGFEVLEVIVDADDIMAVPTSGSVLLSHFEMLLRDTVEYPSRAENCQSG